MKKKTIYGVLALSSLLLGSVGFADEHVPLDDSADTVVITPIDVPINQLAPEDSNLPIEPKDEDQSGEVLPTTDSMPITGPVDIPIITLPNSSDSKPQVPSVSEETPSTDVISEPTLPAGPTVTSDFKEELVTTVASEVVGPVAQLDGTTTVTDSEGQLRVLPATGDDDNLLLTSMGMLSVSLGIIGRLISRRYYKI